MRLIKYLFLSLLVSASILLSFTSATKAARTDNYFNDAGTYIYTNALGGYNWLINGVNKYLNFNSISGSSGYGFRDNSGTIQWKNSGGSWQNIGTGGGSSSTTVWGLITGTLSDQTDLQNVLDSKLSTTTAYSTYVPYAGATGDVNLGDHSLSFNSGSTTQGIIWNTGSVWTDIGGSGIRIGNPIGSTLSLDGSSLNSSQIANFQNLSGYVPLFNQIPTNETIQFDTSLIDTSRIWSWQNKDGIVAFTSDLSDLIASSTANWAGTWQTKSPSDFAASSSVLWGGTLADGIYNLNSGNVGIGKSNPGYKLDVNGDINIAYQKSIYLNTNQLIGQAIDSGYHMQFGLLGSHHNFVDAWTDRLSMNVYNGTTILNALYIPAGNVSNAGYVGIGTTNPQFLLHAYSSSGADSAMYFDSSAANSRIISSSDTSMKVPQIWVVDRTLTSDPTFATTGNAGLFLDRGNLFANRNDFILANLIQDKNIDFLTNSGGSKGVRMTILGSGNVGIGTTTPNQKLTVNGSLGLLGSTSGYVGFTSPATVSTSTIWTLPLSDGTNGQALVTNGSGVLSWSAPATPISGINVYLTNSTSTTLGTYKVLSYVNDASTNTFSGTVTSGESLAKTFIYDTAVGGTTIQAGTWEFNAYAKTSTNKGTSALRFEIFTRTTGGTETTLFSQTSPALTTSYANYDFISTQGQFTVNATDKLGVRVYVVGVNNDSKTISFQVGDNTSTFIKTPLPLRHSLLRDLAWNLSGHTGTASNLASFDAGGNANYTPISNFAAETTSTIGALINGSTATTTPAEADKFAIWGSITNSLQHITWANLKAALKSYFDTIYALIVTDGTPNTDHTANGPQTDSFASGYSATVMDLVYMGTGGKWLATNASSTASSTGMLAFSLESKTDTQAMKVATAGSYVRDDSWTFATGSPLYIATTTSGTISVNQPTGTDQVIRIIGWAVAQNIIYFQPETGYMTHN